MGRFFQVLSGRGAPHNRHSMLSLNFSLQVCTSKIEIFFLRSVKSTTYISALSVIEWATVSLTWKPCYFRDYRDAKQPLCAFAVGRLKKKNCLKLDLSQKMEILIER